MTDSPDGGPISPLDGSGCLQLPYVGTDGPNLMMATQTAASSNDSDAERRHQIVQERMDHLADTPGLSR